MAPALWPKPICNISIPRKGRTSPQNHYFRPRKPPAAAKDDPVFPQLKLFTIDEVFGGWQKAQKTHFEDGGVFDQIYQHK